MPCGNSSVAARNEGPSHNYLIQHSAGSGKTNSISWLSHRLASLHTASDEKIFDCVIVITDRRVLDKQLQDAIYQIEHAQGVVKAIDEDSRATGGGVGGWDKDCHHDFPEVSVRVARIVARRRRGNFRRAPRKRRRNRRVNGRRQSPRRKYAVIVDEAHSSQTGETARELKAILGAKVQSDERRRGAG